MKTRDSFRDQSSQISLLEALEGRLLLSAVPSLSGPLEHWNSGHLPLAAIGMPEGNAPFLSISHASGLGAAVSDDYGNTLATAAGVSFSSSGTASVAGQINYLGDKDVFSFTPAKSGSISVKLVPASKSKISGGLSAYEGTAMLVQDVNAADKSAAVTFNVVGGTTYYIQVASLNGQSGKYALSCAASWLADPTPTPPPVDPILPPPVDPTPPPPIDPTPPPAGKYSPGTQVMWQVESGSDGLHLVILGTDGSDAITVSKSGTNTVIYVSGAQVWTSSQVFSNVALYGFGGNDTLVSISGSSESVWGGAGFDSFWTDSSDTLGDVEAAEAAARSVHVVNQFYSSASVAQPALQLAGQKIADPVSGYAYADFSSYRAFTDGPEYNDIKQGAIGDCYFLAVLSSLAQTDPGIIRQTIAPLGDGTYAVRFFNGSSETYVRVDADLPVYSGSSSLAYAGLSPDGELWVALTEKAYAQFRTGANSYSSLSAGYMGAVYPQITGVSATSVSPFSQTESSLANQIDQALLTGHAVTAGSAATGSTIIQGSHAYEVHSI
ncbi:MAG: C2 family cysteine protease [Planctomycetota bacterium]